MGLAELGDVEGRLAIVLLLLRRLWLWLITPLDGLSHLVHAFHLFVLGELIVGLCSIRSLLHELRLLISRLPLLTNHPVFGSFVFRDRRTLLLLWLGNDSLLLPWPLHSFGRPSPHRLTLRDSLSLVLHELRHLLFDDIHLENLHDVWPAFRLLLDHQHD